MKDHINDSKKTNSRSSFRELTGLASVLLLSTICGCATPQVERYPSKTFSSTCGRTAFYAAEDQKDLDAFVEKHPLMKKYSVYNEKRVRIGGYAEGRGNGMHFYEASNLIGIEDGNHLDGPSKIPQGWTFTSDQNE